MSCFYRPLADSDEPVRIIIADDHPVVLLGIRMALAAFVKPKVQIVAEASSAESLLRMLERQACDLLITDFSMPEGDSPDGMALISYIRRHFPVTKVIVLTMMNSELIIRHLFDLEIKGAVDKHHSLNELNDAISCVLNGGQYVSSSFSAALEQIKRGERHQKDLSAKEFEVIRLLGQGLAGREIAKRLNRSEKTISRQKRSAMQKQGIRSDSGLASLWQAYF